MYVHQDGETGNCNKNGEQREYKTMSRAIGQVGDHHREAKGGSPRGNRVELRRDVCNCQLV